MKRATTTAKRPKTGAKRAARAAKPTQAAPEPTWDAVAAACGVNRRTLAEWRALPQSPRGRDLEAWRAFAASRAAAPKPEDADPYVRQMRELKLEEQRNRTEASRLDVAERQQRVRRDLVPIAEVRTAARTVRDAFIAAGEQLPAEVLRLLPADTTPAIARAVEAAVRQAWAAARAKIATGDS